MKNVEVERVAGITAKRCVEQLDSAFPRASEWQQAQPVTFYTDWQGNSPDLGRQTEVRLLWLPETLFIRFVCRYREIVMFEDADPNGRRDELWDRDVAEVFLQADRFGSRQYCEFEVAPNGFWVDLEIFPGGRRNLNSEVRCTAEMDITKKVWTGQMAIPTRAVTEHFDPAQTWRLNFYRCEGRDPARWYSAWRPTNTPEPSFHVPESFGVMRFEE